MARKTKQNTYVTDEKWKLVNEENKQLYTDFISFCRSTDKSPATLEVYDSNIKIFMIWLLNNAKNKSIINLTKRDVMSFQDWMINTQKLSPARVRHLRASVSSMCNFICDILDEEYPNFRNIINKIKAPAKQDVREKTILSDEQIDNLLKILVDLKRYQQACLVACLSASGVRKGEIIQFKVGFFDENKLVHGMYITPEIRTKGPGSQGKKLSKFIIKDIAKPYFVLWMKQREELGITSEYLFVHKVKGEWKPHTDTTIESSMQTFTKLINEDVYCHCFRHYAATWLRKNDVPIDQIRDFLGHQSSDITKIYIDIGTEDNLKDMLGFMNKSEKAKSDNN